MNNTKFYINKIKSINIDDNIIKYFKRSITHTKDDFKNMSNIATLDYYLKDKYNISIVE